MHVLGFVNFLCPPVCGRKEAGPETSVLGSSTPFSLSQLLPPLSPSSSHPPIHPHYLLSPLVLSSRVDAVFGSHTPIRLIINILPGLSARIISLVQSMNGSIYMDAGYSPFYIH